MKQTYSKKYVTPAILLIVALMAGVLYQLAVVRVPFAWMTQYLLSYGIAFLLMALYCLVFHHRGVGGKTFYFVAVGWLAASAFVQEIWPMLNSPFSLRQVYGLFFFLAVGAMIAVKIKPHFAFFIAGTALLFISFLFATQADMIALKRPTFWQAINFFAVYITLGVQYIALALIMVFEAFGRKRKEV